MSIFMNKYFKQQLVIKEYIVQTNKCITLTFKHFLKGGTTFCPH